MNKSDNYVTVKTFSYAHELSVAQMLLESENIECFVKDELTAQVNPLLSNAIGGVKLQVKQIDFNKAVEVLKTKGFLNDSDLEDENLNLFNKLNRITAKIPFLNKLHLHKRLIVLTILSLIIPTSIFLLIHISTKKNNDLSKFLLRSTWCIDQINYKGKSFHPNSLNANSDQGITLLIDLQCEENLNFWSDSIIRLPGFNSKNCFGNWQIENDKFRISKVDTFDFVYNGLYSFEFSRTKLILKSEDTEIICRNY